MAKQAATKNRGNRKKKLRSVPLSRPVTPEEIIDRCRQYGPASVDTLADVAANGSDSARVTAASTLLDRGFGKVGQQVELSGSVGSNVDMNMTISPAVAEALKTIAGKE